MDEKDLLSFLGLGARAGKIVCGQAKCTAGIRAGKIRLLLLDGSASNGTVKAFTDACRSHRIPWIQMNGRDVLGSSIGKPACRIAGITDAEFARSVVEKYGTCPERERIEQDQDT